MLEFRRQSERAFKLAERESQRVGPRVRKLADVLARRLPSNIGLFLLALIFSFTTWVIITGEQNPPLMDTFPNEIPVEAVRTPPGLVVFSQIQPVRVRISAPRDVWGRLRVSSFQATADLSGLDSGVHEVKVDVRALEPGVSILQVFPATVQVKLEQEISKDVPVRVNVVGTPAYGFEARAPSLSVNQVTVSGPAPLVNEVEAAVGELNLLGTNVTLAQRVELQARDQQGRPMESVKLNPSQVEVTVPIEQQQVVLTVPVHPVIAGEPATGYWITRIENDPSVIALLGPRRVLDTISFIQTRPVDVSGASGTVRQTVELELPEGVTTAGANQVVVTVDVQAITGTRSFLVSPQVQGLGAGLVASASQVTVTLSGEVPILQRLQRSDLGARVDASNFGPGTYDLPVQVSPPNGVSVTGVSPNQSTVTIRSGS